MRRLKNIFNPIFTLIVVQVVWFGLLVLWIIWFFGRHYEFRKLAEQYRPELVPNHINWPVLAGGITMLALILVGLYVIFIYWRRQSRLYAEQKTFISQITHELKSPLASIRLHLETIRLRRPPADKLEKFLDTMLADTERLDVLISNFLMAAKLEQSPQSADFPVIDLSGHLQKSLDTYRTALPEGSSLIVDIENGISAKADPEGLSMMLRNLLENAFIYSAGSPEVKVSLRRNGKSCILKVSDNGRGIAQKDLKKVFRMFYRVRESGDSIKGTGLGLYIVKSIVKRHRGRIHAESPGEGQGSSFVIAIPVVEVK